MSYSRDDYYQEAFEIAMEDSGCGHLLAQMTKEQREFIGGALCGSRECEGQAFYVPESPLIERNSRLERALKWERELEHCRDCNGKGRVSYMAGPWHCNSGCDTCHGEGKVHPRREARPTQ